MKINSCENCTSLYHLTADAREIFQVHLNLLGKLEGLLQGCKIESNGTVLMPNHMIREETFFLNRITQLVDSRVDLQATGPFQT